MGNEGVGGREGMVEMKGVGGGRKGESERKNNFKRRKFMLYGTRWEICDWEIGVWGLKIRELGSSCLTLSIRTPQVKI